ncbi:MAG: hypothetical protein CL973_00910 [Euryarchaeota archaeon]|nr:hypothetical protein [Euryarchaeota archaeon]|tara:strand:+ start:5622 stop:5921 length:300 start_codon:yes stop_codon:yes gene_type:complete
MIIHGSMSHTTSGRRKKRVYKKRAKPPFVPMKLKPDSVFVKDPVWKNNKSAPFIPASEMQADPDREFKRDISSNYTISIPYNKGTYQVIPNDDITHIGK